MPTRVGTVPHKILTPERKALIKAALARVKAKAAGNAPTRKPTPPLPVRRTPREQRFPSGTYQKLLVGGKYTDWGRECVTDILGGASFARRTKDDY